MNVTGSEEYHCLHDYNEVYSCTNSNILEVFLLLSVACCSLQEMEVAYYSEELVNFYQITLRQTHMTNLHSHCSETFRLIRGDFSIRIKPRLWEDREMHAIISYSLYMKPLLNKNVFISFHEAEMGIIV
jgi:hypothetical protein